MNRVIAIRADRVATGADTACALAEADQGTDHKKSQGEQGGSGQDRGRHDQFSF